MLDRFWNFLIAQSKAMGRDTSAATAIEYALIAGLISVASIAAMSIVGANVRAVMTSIGNSLAGVGS